MRAIQGKFNAKGEVVIMIEDEPEEILSVQEAAEFAAEIMQCIANIGIKKDNSR